MRVKDDIRRLVWIAIMVSLGMILFELVTHLVWPDLALRTSHTLTIIVSALIAAVVTNFFFRKQTLLNKKLKEEIDERLHTEEVLRVSEEKYHDLFQNANDAIFIVDANLFYLDVNKKAIEMLGFSKEELLRMKITDLLPPEQLPRSEAEFEKIRNHGSYEQFTGKVRTKDGRWLDVEVNSSAIVENGKVIGSRDIIRDITGRKQAEAERERLIGELQEAMANVKLLSGMLPICASCKKIRDDKGYWTQIEAYIHEHSQAQFTHGLCPDCLKKAMEKVAVLPKNKK
jgi:PAS domain S-box-containing protein